MGKTSNALGQHLSEQEIDKLIREEPEITIREYLDLIAEITQIKESEDTKKTYNDLTLDTFVAKYTLMKNLVQNTVEFDGCMFNKTGLELRYITSVADRSKVWSVIRTKNTYNITPGLHVHNVLGYLVTKQSWKNKDEYYTLIKTGKDENNNNNNRV